MFMGSQTILVFYEIDRINGMPTKDYSELLFEQLRDSEISAGYLSVALTSDEREVA